MYFLALMDRANDRSIQFVQCADEVNAMQVVFERDAIAVGVYGTRADLCAAAVIRWKIVAPTVTGYKATAEGSESAN